MFLEHTTKASVPPGPGAQSPKVPHHRHPSVGLQKVHTCLHFAKGTPWIHTVLQMRLLKKSPVVVCIHSLDTYECSRRLRKTDKQLLPIREREEAKTRSRYYFVYAFILGVKCNSQGLSPGRNSLDEFHTNYHGAEEADALSFRHCIVQASKPMVSLCACSLHSPLRTDSDPAGTGDWCVAACM